MKPNYPDLEIQKWADATPEQEKVAEEARKLLPKISKEDWPYEIDQSQEADAGPPVSVRDPA